MYVRTQTSFKNWKRYSCAHGIGKTTLRGHTEWERPFILSKTVWYQKRTQQQRETGWRGNQGRSVFVSVRDQGLCCYLECLECFFVVDWVISGSLNSHQWLLMYVTILSSSSPLLLLSISILDRSIWSIYLCMWSFYLSTWPVDRSTNSFRFQRKLSLFYSSNDLSKTYRACKVRSIRLLHFWCRSLLSYLWCRVWNTVFNQSIVIEVGFKPSWILHPASILGLDSFVSWSQIQVHW